MDQATKDEVNRLLSSHNRLVVTAPPGAGKSTLLPLSILDALKNGQLGCEGKIIILEPRRLAARQIAERMADLLGEPVGKNVGYRIRFENKISRETQIEVLTEGILTRQLVNDPTLDGVAVVVFDEFHERNIASDVALALTREAQQIIRPDLKIIVMSATIDTTFLCKSLDAPLVESHGRTYPIELRRSNLELIPLIRQVHQEHEGDILVFLPGEAEIRKCKEQLDTKREEWPNTSICPLYGLLSQQEQQKAIAPSQLGQRKIVLATPIAETSLTIQGVRIVIDSGLCRKMVYNAQNGLSHLETVQISMDMAIQRMGRAGRVAPGICYRMWSIATEQRMKACRTPEIEEADLAPILLDIAAWGADDASGLPWISPLPTSHITQAKQLLQLLGAFDEKGHITQHGKRLANLPCHPRISQMLLLSDSRSEQLLACHVAALLEEKDPLANLTSDADLRTRFGHETKRIKLIAEQYARLLKIDYSINEQSAQLFAQSKLSVGRIIASAYPERIAKATNDGCGRFRMANGEEAYVDVQDELSSHEWLAIAHVNARANGGRIFLAAPIEPYELESLTRSKENASWDSRKGMVVAQMEYRIGTLIVRTEPIKNADAAHLIGLAAQKEGRSMLDFNDKVQNLQRRVAAVATWHPEMNLPDLSTEIVLQRAPEWLPLYVGKATTVAELKKIDLCIALWGLLSYEQQMSVNRLAPTHITVPTGSHIQVEYRQGAELPVLRVRLQECFGLEDTPCVDDGKCPVLIELLSPGFKPVQLTKDLRNFWRETYFEVRKELRRRYPKHAWPDNPLEAEAVRGVKKNQS